MKITILSSILLVLLNLIELISSADRAPDIPPGFPPPQSPRIAQSEEASSSRTKVSEKLKFPLSANRVPDIPPGFPPPQPRPVRQSEGASSSQPSVSGNLNASSAPLRYPKEGKPATYNEFKIGSIDNKGKRHPIWCEGPRVSRVKVHVSGEPVEYITEEVFNQLMDAFFKSRLDKDIKMPKGHNVIDDEGYIIAVIKDGNLRKIKRNGETVEVHVSGMPWKFKSEGDFIERVYRHSGPIVSRETAIDDVMYYLLDHNTGPPGCMKIKILGVWYDAVKKEPGSTYPTSASNTASTSSRGQGGPSKRGRNMNI